MLRFLMRLFVCAAGFSALAGAYLFAGLLFYLVNPSLRAAGDQVVTVRSGAGLREIASDLDQRGIITDRTFFIMWARGKGYARQIKAGEYLLNASMPPIRVLDLLSKGAVMTHPVTIPEGFNLRQIADLFEAKGLVKKDTFLTVAQEPATATRYGLVGPGIEGFLFPDTYHFAKGQSAHTVIDTMVRRFFEALAPLWPALNKSQMSLQQIVTLASIVEKETGQASERPLVASVFLNRLKTGMRLESDPTVIYGLKDFNGNLTRKDLTHPTPYNTYVVRGLPPSPIACPGIESIRAVLHPADKDFLYFVSKNDGSHHFSTSLSEHNRAVAMYQKGSRQ